MLIHAQTLTVQNRPTRVWRGGDGPALLLVHGGLGDAQLHWETVWEPLAETFTVLAPDLPGFGETAPLPNANFPALAQWLVDLMETSGLPQTLVVGNSFGGGVARLLAAQHPAQVVGLTLVNGGALPELPPFATTLMRLPGLSDWLFDQMRRATFSRSGLRPLFADQKFLTPSFITRSQQASTGFVRAMREAAFTPTPAHKTPPGRTLILWGEADRFAPLASARKLAAAIPHAQLQTLPQAGHMPQIEQPAAFIAAIQKFCRA